MIDFPFSSDGSPESERIEVDGYVQAQGSSFCEVQEDLLHLSQEFN